MPSHRSFLTSAAAVYVIGRLAAQTPATGINPAKNTAASHFHLVEATIDQIHSGLNKDEITCRQLVAAYLRRIEAYDKAGPGLNAVQTVNAHALQEADRLDAALRTSGLVGKLHCIPVLVKDQLEMPI